MEENKPYTEVFTSFGGADCIAILNGKTIGEVQELTYVEDFSANKIKGEIRVTMFDRFSFRDAMNKAVPDTFILHFANEYGQFFSMNFVGIEFKKRTGGVTVDTIFMEEIYTYECADILIDREKKAHELTIAGVAQ